MNRQLNWDFIRRCLAFRREEKKLTELGYRRHEPDWEIIRGSYSQTQQVILDAKIGVDGKSVYTKIGLPKKS